MHFVSPWPAIYKAIIQKRVGNCWEDIEPIRHIPVVFKYLTLEVDDGLAYDVINGEPSYWVKGKGWRDRT
jgi:hypothetical protein